MELLAEIFDVHYLPYNKIPEDMINIVIATKTEDFDKLWYRPIWNYKSVVHNYSSGNPMGQCKHYHSTTLTNFILITRKSWERK